MELNKIYNLDNVEGMRMMEKESVDLVVTSPPYDNLRTYKGFSFDFNGIVSELWRIMKVGGGNCLDCLRCNDRWERDLHLVPTSVSL